MVHLNATLRYRYRLLHYRLNIQRFCPLSYIVPLHLELFGSNATIYTSAAESLYQTTAKRACATAIVNLVAQLGNIWSPYFFRPQDSPHYLLAMLPMMGFSWISVICSLLMRTILRRENKKLARAAEESGTRANLYSLLREPVLYIFDCLLSS